MDSVLETIDETSKAEKNKQLEKTLNKIIIFMLGVMSGMLLAIGLFIS